MSSGFGGVLFRDREGLGILLGFCSGLSLGTIKLLMEIDGA